MKQVTLGSHFDGIAGFPLAASIAGIKAVWATEIEPFPIQVSKEHFPEMKHYGSITDVSGTELEPVDIITGGFPCQDLSVAGKRSGLKGERSGLFFEIVRTIREMREATNGIYPRVVVLENVPGLLSSAKGQDFKIVLEELTETEVPMPKSGKWATNGVVRTADREVAWTVLDAQYFGVPQRRRRVFIVCDFTKRCAAEILFESEGLPRDTSESGKTREEVATGAGDGVEATSRVFYKSGPGWISEGVGCLKAEGENRPSRPTHTILEPIALDGGTIARTLAARGDSSPCIDRGQEAVLVPRLYDMTHAEEVIRPVTPGLLPTLNARMGTGGNQIPVMVDKTPVAFGPGGQHDIAHAVRAQASKADKLSSTTYVAVAYDPKDLGRRPATFEDCSPTLKQRAGTGGNNVPVTITGYAVRRLLPIECERLQGFPDKWTDVPGASDTARYKAIGNSVAIPCVAWIMQRIAQVLQG